MSKVLNFLKDSRWSTEQIDKAFERMRADLGDTALLDALVKAMGKYELGENLEFLARVYDYDETELFENKANVDDDLTQPKRVDNRMKGEGKIDPYKKTIFYKDFIILTTTDGKYNVYDKQFAVYGVNYNTLSEAKADIDKYPEEKIGVYTEEEKESRTALNYKGYNIREIGEGSFDIYAGGESNTGLQELIEEDFGSVGEALEYLIEEEYIDPPRKDGTFPNEKKAYEYLKNTVKVN